MRALERCEARPYRGRRAARGVLRRGRGGGGVPRPASRRARGAAGRAARRAGDGRAARPPSWRSAPSCRRRRARPPSAPPPPPADPAVGPRRGAAPALVDAASVPGVLDPPGPLRRSARGRPGGAARPTRTRHGCGRSPENGARDEAAGGRHPARRRCSRSSRGSRACSPPTGTRSPRTSPTWRRGGDPRAAAHRLRRSRAGRSHGGGTAQRGRAVGPADPRGGARRGAAGRLPADPHQHRLIHRMEIELRVNGEVRRLDGRHAHHAAGRAARAASA